MIGIPELKKKETLRVASFDIGRKNFAVYVEDFDTNYLLHDLKNQQKKIGKVSLTTKIGEEHLKIIQKVYQHGKRVFWDVADLDPNSKSKYLTMEHYLGMIHYLDTYKVIFETCDAIIIEQQTVKNPSALKLGQHCMSYFLIHWGETKYISTISSRYKTKLLGAPASINTKPKRKRWCIQEAKQVMISREDTDGIVKIGLETKKDDLGDTCMQLQAFKYKYFVN